MIAAACSHCGATAGSAAGLATHVRRLHPERHKDALRSIAPSPDLPRLALSLDIPLDEALERWRLARVAAPATAKGYASVVRSLALAGLCSLSDLSAERFSAYLTGRMAVLSASAANVHWSAVCSILANLERQNMFPLEALTKLRRLKPKKPSRARLCATFLTREDFDKLCAGARSTARPRTELVVQVGVLAGLRAAELARLRWEDFAFASDRPTGSLVVRLRPELGDHGRIKTGRERIVPLVEELVEALAPHRKPTGFVFEQLCHRSFVKLPFSQVRVLRKDLRRASKAAGLDGVTFHLLRHTRASWWLQHGVTPVKVAKWLGHSTQVLELHYAGLRDGYDVDAELAPERGGR